MLHAAMLPCCHAACCNAKDARLESQAKALLLNLTLKGVVFLTGKSSLLAALLGEMEQRCGHMRVQGTVAYVPQHPWILTGTLRYILRKLKHLRVILLQKTGTHSVSVCTYMPWS